MRKAYICKHTETHSHTRWRKYTDPDRGIFTHGDTYLHGRSNGSAQVHSRTHACTRVMYASGHGKYWGRVGLMFLKNLDSLRLNCQHLPGTKTTISISPCVCVCVCGVCVRVRARAWWGWCGVRVRVRA